ncbi:class I SAM-dependent methyltransferase [Pseudoxanthomonas winnipegensis]|uniref:Class I SAM-dependent methyltransferase n=1 Tax=Pseudoxanthomonas winnipegensis TaxID=2480810 RepID=A0A4Q8LWZ2_9GAMM|nr:class I SAM-dependent methyltransferase [Pseudoxanthomonas winnipegensis]TAA37033.1 class I SAM-dependent methyltransferase [Pseudoxanthomonas winnipegensis]
MNPATHPAASAAGQAWDAARYARNAGFVPALGASVSALLDARPGERILDLGCGDGVLTAQLVQAGADVVGVDASPELVAAAVERGIDARVMDGHALTFEGDFDAVFSNAALHWMRQPDAVLAGVRRALKPGGRFVAEFGGHGNVAAITTALRAALQANGAGAPAFAWFFPTAEEYAARLAQHGFEVAQIALIPRPTPLPTGIAGWLQTFADPFLSGLNADTRGRVLADTEALLRPALCDAAGQWHADYVRLRFSARRSPTPHSTQGHPQ